MFVITPTNKIILTKNDNAEIDVRVFNKDGVEIEIKDTDDIYLTVKKSAQGSVLVHKKAMLNSIFLTPVDTETLPAGIYVYDVDFTRDNERQTIVPESIFELREEI